MKFFDNLHSDASLDNLVLSKRQVSNICAALVFVFMLVFALGYFWGKKNAAQQFSDKVANESFEDKVNYSLFSLYNNSSSDEEVALEEAVTEPAKAVGVSEEMKAKEELVEEVAVSQPEAELKGPEHYAELIGFSTQKAANLFLAKAQSKGYPVKIRTRTSSTPKGKTIKWYQAVTERFSDKQELQQLTKRIEKSEFLGKSKIVTV